MMIFWLQNRNSSMHGWHSSDLLSRIKLIRYRFWIKRLQHSHEGRHSKCLPFLRNAKSDAHLKNEKSLPIFERDPTLGTV